jgi:hypothetical protein
MIVHAYKPGQHRVPGIVPHRHAARDGCAGSRTDGRNSAVDDDQRLIGERRGAGAIDNLDVPQRDARVADREVRCAASGLRARTQAREPEQSQRHQPSGSRAH